jgi:outer membrane biosynthesis protein TonB
VKFDFDNASGNIKTKVYQNADGDRTELNTPTLDDVTKYIKYKCDFRPVIALSKLFASKAADDSGKRKYGFGLKIKHIEVKPSQMSAQDQDENAFVDDEDDEFVERRILVKETKKVVEKDEDEDEDEEEEEEEEKPVPSAKAKVSAKAVKKVEVEEEEEEEEKKPAPKARRARAGKSSDVI